MKTRTYTKLMAAAVLASSLLLGACGKKEESATSASSSKTVQASSSSKLRHPVRSALLLRLAIALLQKEQLASLDKPKFLLISNSLLLKHLKPNKRSRSKLRVDKTLRLKQLNQPKHQKAIASFRINKQLAMLAIKVS